jgi:hypothetical protein
MTRSLFAALLVFVSLDAAACPLCLGAFQQSTAQQLVDLQHAVLALPAADGSSYRVVEVIKGERPSSGTVGGAAVHLKVAATGNKETLLLARDDTWPMWAAFGTIGAEHASWLRQLAAGKRWIEMGADEWRARVSLMLPYLENPEPLVAEIAHGELATAPYAALLTIKSRIAASSVRRWLGDPALLSRQSLYLLLLGIAGDATDAVRLESRLDAAWQAGDATSLGSLIAADLQLRGPARVAWVDEHYLRDRKRATREIEAALLALSVHGNANGVIPRARVIQSYRAFMKERPDIAGFVARDLAAWQYWDAVPEYVALMKSDIRQQYPSRLAIVGYLRQSPGGSALGADLTQGEASELARGKPWWKFWQSDAAARGANAIPVLPQ